mgnify:CR=1 FL=1
MNSYRSFEDRILSVRKCQPDLKLIHVGEDACEFAGIYHLEVNRKRIAGYRIRFILSKNDRHEPIVQLLDNYFSFNVDRHIYSDGQCCICVWLHWTFFNGYRIDLFLQKAVRDFFLSQIYYDEHEKYLFDWDHGPAGIYKAFADILLVPNKRGRVQRRLRKLINGEGRSNRVSVPQAAEMMAKLDSLQGQAEGLKVPQNS